MNAAQAAEQVEQKARLVVGLLPGLPTARPKAGIGTLNCSDENQPPEVEGVSISRDYTIEPVTTPDQAHALLEAGFTALTGRGYTVITDERTLRAPGFILQDPADDFRVQLGVAVDGTYTTLAISSPCVAPTPAAPPT